MCRYGFGCESNRCCRASGVDNDRPRYVRSAVSVQLLVLCFDCVINLWCNKHTYILILYACLMPARGSHKIRAKLQTLNSTHYYETLHIIKQIGFCDGNAF